MGGGGFHQGIASPQNSVGSEIIFTMELKSVLRKY